MTYDKELAFCEFCDMVKKSWTFGRMTAREQADCLATLQWVHDQGMLRGTFNTRWSILQAVYHAYLSGLGYDAFGWREDGEYLYDKNYWNPSETYNKGRN